MANGGVTLVGDTIDNGTIEFNIKSDPPIPYLNVTGNLFEYASNAAWSMSAWITGILRQPANLHEPTS